MHTTTQSHTYIQSFKSLFYFSLISLLAACDGGNETPDTTPPLITLNGENSITLIQGDTYTEQGAKAVDEEDGIVDVIISGSVDTTKVGSYLIVYTAFDSSNNVSSLERTITIIADTTPDTTSPVVTLIGNGFITLYQNSAYIEQGATALDDRDGAISVVVSGLVNTSILGNYPITYTATDTAGNIGAMTRTITVIGDTAPPVITLNGDSSINIFQGSVYIEEGAAAFDEKDGSIEVVISGSVDTNVLGEHTITYTAIDVANNSSTETRTVTVIADTIPPVITLNGESSISISIGSTYEEQGATATDNNDESVNITVSGFVDANTSGDYTITYSATDAAGNIGTATRIITVVPPRPFITTWKTDNPGETSNLRIAITTSGEGYDYDIDWGDGSSDSNVTGYTTHFYASAGTYTVTISGDFPQIFFGGGDDARKLLSVEQWGDVKWRSMNKAFFKCENLVINATDTPDLSLVTDMSSMFNGASSVNQDISEWDVSSVTNMTNMFTSATNFNQNISLWDVSSVTNMTNMFYATSFNQSIGTWDVSSVTNMSYMFHSASSFDQDLSAWDVSSVTTMEDMFFNVTLSSPNYNALLIGWAARSLQSNVKFHAGNSAFSTVAASSARNTLTNPDGFNWDITDGGCKVC